MRSSWCRCASGSSGARTRVPCTRAGEPVPPLLGTVRQFGAVRLQAVATRADHGWWRELIGRYHYLGYRVPFGAQLLYLAFVSQPTPSVVATLQVSSPAWQYSPVVLPSRPLPVALATRDRWIGWDEPTRMRQLQRVVNNSRFLVLPWVRVKNFASLLLALLAKRLAADWHARFAIEPLLIETMVDRGRFAGTCYRAANSIELGDTSGRGRMDRAHSRHGQAPRRVLVYPLVADAQRRLVEAL